MFYTPENLSVDLRKERPFSRTGKSTEFSSFLLGVKARKKRNSSFLLCGFQSCHARLPPLNGIGEANFEGIPRQSKV